MKIVTRISSQMLADKEALCAFGRALSEFIEDAHRVVVVHDCDNPSPGQMTFGNGAVAAKTDCGAETLSAVAPERLNKLFSAALGQCRVHALGLSGSDASIVRLTEASNAPPWTAGVADVETPWLDIISRHRGIPVLASMAASQDGTFCMINADQLAAQTAVSWQAEALLFLIGCDAVKTGDGTTVRWMSRDRLEELVLRGLINHSMQSRLLACQYAIRHGVHRAIVFPLSQIARLSQFHQSKTELSTDAILFP